MQSAQGGRTTPEHRTRWTVGRLVHATGGRLVSGDLQLPVAGISLDSRRLEPLEAFLAIRGLRFDGHRFVQDVVQRGAGCLIVSESIGRSATPTILVDDTTKALGRLAGFHRAQHPVPVVAVTGSCGKTTTKELIAHLLGPQYAVLKTHLTENNHIGLPLTLLKLDRWHDVAVVELGSNHPGEIAYLAGIAQPTVALVTNIGPAHLEFFGSLEGVLKEKLSLIDALGPHGVAVVPGDQLDVVLEATRRLPAGASLVTFGSSQRCDVQALDVCKRPEGWSLRLRGVAGEFALPLPGAHNVENTLAALAALRALGIPLDGVRDALARFSPPTMRSELVRGRRLTILNDCYNANPLSFARALETLRDLDVARRVVVAGEMLELGGFAASAHEAVGRLAAQCGASVMLAVGAFASHMAKGAAGEPSAARVEVRCYPSVDDLLPELEAMVLAGDGVLVKGSRKLKLERVVTRLLELDRAELSGPEAVTDADHRG